jgi:hypothetical protein
MIWDRFTIIGMVMTIGVVAALVYFCKRGGCIKPR